MTGIAIAFVPVACASSRIVVTADAAGVVSRQAWKASDAAIVLHRTLSALRGSGTGAAAIDARDRALNWAVKLSPAPGRSALDTHESTVVEILLRLGCVARLERQGYGARRRASGRRSPPPRARRSPA